MCFMNWSMSMPKMKMKTLDVTEFSSTYLIQNSKCRDIAVVVTDHQLYSRFTVDKLNLHA